MIPAKHMANICQIIDKITKDRQDGYHRSIELSDEREEYPEQRLENDALDSNFQTKTDILQVFQWPTSYFASYSAFMQQCENASSDKIQDIYIIFT